MWSQMHVAEDAQLFKNSAEGGSEEYFMTIHIMDSAVKDLMNSSENLLLAPSGGRVSQVKGRQHVYSIELLLWSRPTETSSLQTLSLSRSLSQAFLCSHALPDPPAQRGVPSTCLKKKKL